MDEHFKINKDVLGMMQLFFVYSTYLAVIFVLCGWAMLLYVSLKIHKAARTGELVRAECRKGHLELETGQAVAQVAYNEGNCRQMMQTALSFVKTAILCLAASVCFPFLWGMMKLLKQNGKFWKKDHWKPFLAVSIWILGALWTFPSVIAASATSNETITTAFISVALGVLVYLFCLPKYYEDPTFFEHKDISVPSKIWLITLVFTSGMWMASTMYCNKINKAMENYTQKLDDLKTALMNINRPFILRHLEKNFKLIQQENGAPDDPPSAITYDSLLDGDPVVQKAFEARGDVYIPPAVYYLMHNFGNELQDVESMIRNEYKNYKTDTEGVNKETVINDALAGVYKIRKIMNELRVQNDESNGIISNSTGWLVASSSLVILLPVFVIYLKFAPVLFEM